MNLQPRINISVYAIPGIGASTPLVFLDLSLRAMKLDKYLMEKGSHKREYADLRKIQAYYLRKHFNLEEKEVGRYVNLDRSTVNWSVSETLKLKSSTPDFKRKFDIIGNLLQK